MVDARTKSGGERRTFATQREAETFADQCRVRRENEGTVAFGDDELARYGKTVRDAVSFYLAHLRQIERSVPVATAVDELITSRRSAGKSREYCDGLGIRMGRFKRDFGNATVSSISVKELDAWLVGLPVAPATRNTFRRDLQTLFSFCVKRGYAVTNAAAATEVAKDVDKPVGILTVEEAEKLLAACDEYLLPFVAVALFAGLRTEEIEKLDWSEIDLERRFIEVKAHKAKTARRRLVKISENLAKWLAPLSRESGSVAPNALRDRLEKARRRAGFGPIGSETEDERAAGLKLKPWPRNACRHSFGSYWLSHHEDVAALALQMGNSPAMIFRHYREVVNPEEAHRYWAIAPAV